MGFGHSMFRLYTQEAIGVFTHSGTMIDDAPVVIFCSSFPENVFIFVSMSLRIWINGCFLFYDCVVFVVYGTPRHLMP